MTEGDSHSLNDKDGNSEDTKDSNASLLVVDDEFKALLALAVPPVVLTSTTMSSTLHGIVKLDLPRCNLSSFPDSFATLLPNLSILFCPNNEFEELPAVVGSCCKLQMISFKSNHMKRIHPDALQAQLKWLILTDNEIESIPDTIGRCHRLQKCMLAGNRLTQLPNTISNCTSLELIRLSSNLLQEPPMILLSALPHLKWIALADNPFLEHVVHGAISATSATTTAVPLTLPILDIPEEDDGIVLGQGASGITRQVNYRGTAVACKQFVSTMTSDGNPFHERKVAMVMASLSKSSKSKQSFTTSKKEGDDEDDKIHCLIKILGETSRGSLVMELLQNYEALAFPPSMETCSRDVYPVDIELSSQMTKTIVTRLLTTMTKLHAHSLCHGDFYGHNILISNHKKKARGGDDADSGIQVKLSDFGAAFFYDKQAEYGALVEQIELRAFGILVEELQRICQAEDFLSQELLELAKACHVVPTFAALQERWTSTLSSSHDMNDSSASNITSFSESWGAASGA